MTASAPVTPASNSTQVVAGSGPATIPPSTHSAQTTSTPAGTDTIIVTLSAGTTNPVRTARAAVREAAAGIAGVTSARQIGTDVVSVKLDTSVGAAVATKLAKAVAAQSGVEAADRSLTFTPAGTSTVQNYQWNLGTAASYGVDAAGAWTTTTGMDSSGRPVIVGVVDTGIASNAALPPTTQTKVTAANGARVAGTTGANLQVVVTAAGEQQLCTTTSSVSGAFTCGPLNPKPADGDVLTVTATDAVGRTSVAKWVVGDTSTPTPTMKPSNGDTIVGTAEVGATIALTYHHNGADVAETQTVTAGDGGTWTVTPSVPLDNGDIVTAVATDLAGNVSDAATLTIDRDAPDAPVLAPTQGTDVKGTKEAGSFVTVTWTDESGEHHTLVLAADAATSWEVMLEPSAKDGTTITATATDPSGNVSDPGTTKADHTPPAAPTVAPSNGAKVSVSGVEAGATPTIVDDNGDLVHGSWADKGSGDWLFTPTEQLTEQDVVFIVLTDAAGNASEPVPVLVDTTAPDKPVISPTSGRVISGTAEAGSTITITYFRHGSQKAVTTTDEHGVWSTDLNPSAANGRPITVTATDAAGNVSTPASVVVDATPPSSPTVALSNGQTVSVSGVETGATVSLVDAEDVEVAGQWASVGDHAWTFTPDHPLTQDADVSVVVTDAAGNSCVPVAVEIDTTAPAAPVITTSTSTQVAGSAEPGATVKLTYRDADDAEHTTDPVVADGGTWTVVLDPAAKAGSEVKATATDAAGNTSEAATATVPEEPLPDPSPSESTGPEVAAAGSGRQVVSPASDSTSIPITPETAVDNGTNLVGAVLPGYDFVDGDTDPSDPSSGSHGTHVAGIVADSGVGVAPAGAAPAVQIEPLRAMNASGGTMAAVIAAINWGAGNFGDNPYPVDVLNLSIETQGATMCPVSLQQAIDAAVAKGVVVVAAAGNYNASISTSAPANCNNVIVATASTSSGARAGYSSWGTSATSAAWLVAAPGGSGDATVVCGATSCPPWILAQIGDSLVGKAGTSMAAPHVAAVAALLKAANPALTPAQIARIIRGTATPMHDGCPTAVCGSGIVNAAAAVAKAGDATSVGSADGVAAAVAAAVTGTRQVGAVLTAAALSSATAYTAPSSYQWLRNGVAIAGETSSSYRIVGADYGQVISVRVSTALGGTTAIVGAGSVWTRGYLAPLTKPTATGKSYKVKKTLKATIGVWSPVPPTKVTYQWYRNSKKIKRATKATYKLTKPDRGKKVKVKVTVSALGYYTTYAYSSSHKIKR